MIPRIFTPRIRNTLLALAVPALFTACGGEAPAPEGGRGEMAFAGSVDALAGGGVHVRSPATGMWADGEEWKLVEELRIGSADEEGPALFGDVAGLEVDPLGRIWVLEGQAREIRVFDASGRHVRTVGRKGGGPGEFEAPSGLFWDPRGRLWTVDQRNARYTVLDTAGALVETHRRQGSGFVLLPWRGGMDREGRILDVGVARGGGHPLGTAAIIRLAPGLRGRDTLRLPLYQTPQVELRGARSVMTTAVPFTPRQLWRVDPEGRVWIGVSDRYRLAALNLAGDTVRVVEREWEPEPVTAEERDSALAGLREFSERGVKTDPSRIPATKPAFRDFFVDGDGYLWVVPMTRHAGDGGVLDVFDPAGRYLGRVRSPVALRPGEPLVARGGHLWTVARDEVDVPYVVRLRIQGRGATPAR